MLSSNRHPVFFFTILLLAAGTRAQSQQQAQGFGVERFYLSAPGAGWFVMDTLDMHGGLGGALSLTSGYEKNAVTIAEGSQQLHVVATRAFMDIGGAVTYDRWRFYVNLELPLYTTGHSGTLGGYSFTAPSVSLASHPDTLSDVRLGVDLRLVGEPTSCFRLGVGGQLFIPNGNRADYDTDGTYRAMFRILFAGDQGVFTYAGQLGVHVRPLDDYPTPQSPQGSELLFGIAGGAKLPVGPTLAMALVVGPELYGATAFRAFFGSSATALEGLLSVRLESRGERGPQLRFKLGAGGGINPQFGAPEWRVVLGIELFNHSQAL